MSKGLFLKALGVQTLLIAVVFATLVALPLREGFFEDYGLITGPVAWIGCSLITAQLLRMPTGYVLFAALAGGVAGVIVSLVTSHTPGLIVSLLVFGASCAGYEPERDVQPA